MGADLDARSRDVAHEARVLLGIVTGDVKRPGHTLARKHVDEARDAAFGGVTAVRARAERQLPAPALQRRAVKIQSETDNAARTVRPVMSLTLGERDHLAASIREVSEVWVPMVL